jgi:DNA-binding NtrC family response regulator
MMAQPTVVIVVDDNAGLLKSVARLLAHHGIDSRTFASAEALLESDSVQTATCLLLDIHLGGISGIELQRRLAASGSKWPVIFMTANDNEAMRNEAMDAGCIAYLRKPFEGHECILVPIAAECVWSARLVSKMPTELMGRNGAVRHSPCRFRMLDHRSDCAGSRGHGLHSRRARAALVMELFQV